MVKEPVNRTTILQEKWGPQKINSLERPRGLREEWAELGSQLEMVKHSGTSTRRTSPTHTWAKAERQEAVTAEARED